MNNRHRRVAKLKKQELNAAKKKFEKEYGISATDAAGMLRSALNAAQKIAKGFSAFLRSFQKSEPK